MSISARITGTIVIPTNKHLSLSKFIVDNLSECNTPTIETIRKETNYIHTIDVSFIADNMAASIAINNFMVQLKPYAKSINLYLDSEWWM